MDQRAGSAGSPAADRRNDLDLDLDLDLALDSSCYVGHGERVRPAW
ncbi:hypothetical protein [Streptomyces sp. NPDC005423]